jgi:hypothetical protein
MNSKVLVSGASGPIGAALLPALGASGYSVTCLVRRAPTGDGQIQWEPTKPLAPQTVSGFDAVIHLAGEGIVGRWTAAKKARIRDSRVQGTLHVAQALAHAEQKPRVFICASAIGYYGNRGDEPLREESPAGTGFLAQVCQEWENATRPASEVGIGTVQLRIGVVLSPSGGALRKMLTPFKMGVGGMIGNGRQWMSWIDVQDLVGAIQHILKNDSLRGPVNMVAPKPVTNAEFTKTLAGVLSRPAILPMPAFAVRLVFGEMGDAVLLGSQRVAPMKLAGSRYAFRFPELRAALESTLRK